MGRVIFDISMSLDGFVRASNPTPEEPLGKGREHLHDWAMEGDSRGQEMLGKAVGQAGAMICGRKTYDDSIRFWQANGPSGEARLPLFVVTHEPPGQSPENGVYHFVEDGIEAALQLAQAAAGEKNVLIMGGPGIARQYLRAGLVDDVSLHVAPLMFGSGLPLFYQDDDHRHVLLGTPEVRETDKAVHIRYPVRR
jgi:dihydrofolate reductase